MKKLILIAILLDSMGCFSQTEAKIVKDSLPEPVKKEITKKYNDYSISNIIKSSSVDGSVVYKFEARKAKSGNGSTTVNILYLTYDAKGNMLSKKKDKEIYYTDSPPPKKKPSTHGSGDGHNH